MDENTLTFEELCDIVKTKVFGYKNIKEDIILMIHKDILDASAIADEQVLKYLKDKFNLSDDVIKDVISKVNEDERRDSMIEALNYFIEDVFKNKTISKDGFCLKDNLLHKAVQMRNNKDMLGFITKLDDETTRFVYVDFGGKEDKVKIDVDELIIAG